MRILHINCNYIGTALHQLMVERLDGMGYENTVFVPTYDSSLSVISPNDNVIVSECFKKRDRLVFDYKQQKIFYDIQGKIDVKDCDLIHAYTLFTDGNCARRLSKKYNIPYVVAIRNTDVNDFFAKMIHLRGRGIRNMLEAEAVFFLSEAYKKQVFDKYVPKKYKDILLKKTYVISNGIDDFWLENICLQPKRLEINKKIRLVYAGRIDKNKNIPTTQKAMEILRERGYDASLTVVGKVQDQAEYERILKDGYTECLPAAPKERLIEIYRESDIFVMPSFTESFGLVYAEAMSQGLPVVYSMGQGFDNQFPEGTVGYHADSHSPCSVADAIEKIIQNYPEISRAAAENARRFSWGEIACRYDGIYKKLEEK